MGTIIKHGDFGFDTEKVEQIAKEIEVVNLKKAFWGDFCTRDGNIQGDKLTIRRQVLIDPAAVAILAEGGTPDEKQLKVTSFAVTASSYGDYIKTTREAVKMNRDPIIDMARDQLAHNRLYDIESVRSSAYVGTTNTITKGQNDTWADLFDNAAVRLFKNGGKHDGAYYVAIVTPEVAKLIKKEALGSGAPLVGTDKGVEASEKGYIGSYAEFAVYKCSDACMYSSASNGTATHKLLFIALTDAGKWPVVSRGAEEGNIEVIVHEPGSAGTNDPLNQFCTIGARVDNIAAALERPELVLKCSVASTNYVTPDIPGDFSINSANDLVLPEADEEEGA